MCGAKLLLPDGLAMRGPGASGDPEDAGEVWSWNDVFLLDQDGEALRARCIGDNRFVVAAEVDEDEHLAAESFVTEPEDEVVSPLHRLGYMGKCEEESAGSLDVHDESIGRKGVQSAGLQLPLVPRFFPGVGSKPGQQGFPLLSAFFAAFFAVFFAGAFAGVFFAVAMRT